MTREAAAANRAGQYAPLDGVRITDIGWVLAVPHATSWLATFGADVIRVESSVRPDITRLGGLRSGADGIPGINRSSMYNGVNFGKRSIMLDLSQPRGIEVVKELVRQSDIVTENFAAGVMDRMGLSYEVLREIKPDIIMLSGSPLGQDGPDKDATGFGPNTQAYAGLPYITGYEGGMPTGLGRDYPDFMIGVHMAFSVLAALHHRNRSGEGQWIEVAMAETVTSTIPEAVLDYTMNGRETPRRGNRHPHFAPRGVYRSAGDDKWVAISVGSDGEWQAFGEALGSPGWTADPRFATHEGRLAHHDELDERISAWARERSHYEATEQLQQHGIPAAPVLDVFETLEDPQLAALGAFGETVHPEVGKRVLAGLPGRFSAIPEIDYGRSPLLGEHTEEVLGGLLGLSAEELAELTEQGITV